MLNLAKTGMWSAQGERVWPKLTWFVNNMWCKHEMKSFFWFFLSSFLMHMHINCSGQTNRKWVNVIPSVSQFNRIVYTKFPHCCIDSTSTSITIELFLKPMLSNDSVTAFLESMVIKFTMPASVYRDECVKWTSCDWLSRCWETTETEELSDSLMCQFDLKCQTKNHFYFFLSKKKQYAVNEKKLLNNICCIHICL